MPTYQGKKRGHWRVVIWHHGKPLEWQHYGTKRTAEQFEAEKRLELKGRARAVRRGAPSLADFCRDEYERYAEANLSGETWGKVRVYQVATLCRYVGHVRLTDFSTKVVEGYKTARKEATWRNKPVGATTINNELRVLGAIFTHARNCGYDVPTVALKKLPSEGRKRVRVWAQTDVVRLLDVAKEQAPWLWPMLITIANTGLRKGEAIHAERSWLDVDRGLLNVQPIFDEDDPIDNWAPKNRKPREVPLPDHVLELLATTPEDQRWLFPNSKGDRYGAFPKNLFWRIRGSVGLSGGPHTLRHSFASAFLAEVPDMFLLARILGHSHTTVTEVYSHLLPDHLQRGRNAVAIGISDKTMGPTMGNPGPQKQKSSKLK